MPRYAQLVPVPHGKKIAPPHGASRPHGRPTGPERSATWHAIQLKAAQIAAARAPEAASQSGLPGGLKTGVERLSGLAMDDVRVHRNSTGPAKLGAHAYASGSDIHLGPGQERHLPHEAWHVVQQKQGRVRPTMQLKGRALNDSAALEREADDMGTKAMLADPAADRRISEGRRPVQRQRAGEDVIQARIMFRDRSVWNDQTQLPNEIKGTPVEDKVKSGDLYLAQTTADMHKRARGDSAPILTPHRHLIGEEHHKSKFETAAKDWGFGADKMLESYQESALVPDKLAEANRQVAGWSLGVKSLENYHAYMLTGFGALKAYLYRLGAATEISLGHAKLVRDGAGGAAQPFKDSEKTADKHRKSARAEWAGIQLHLPSYKDAWTRQPQQLADLNFMRFLWTTVTGTLIEITDRPYNIFTSWTDTATGLTDTSARIQRFITDIIDLWAAALIKLTATEVAAAMPVGQPPADAFAAAGLTGSWNAALANPFETLSPVREFFMVKLINANLRVPGIVGVGEAHLKGIGDKIVEGKVHQSYEQFVRAISDDPIVLPL